LQQYSNCPYSFYLQRIARDENGERLKQLTAGWFLHGTAVHAALEAWERSGRTINAVAYFYAEYDGLIAEQMLTHPEPWEWLRGGRGKTREADIAQRRKQGAEQVAKYVAWAPLQPFQVWTLPDGNPALEVPFTVRLGDVEVIGFIDAIWQWLGSDELEPVDYKTGSQPPEDALQLGLYSLAIQRAFSEDSRHGRYFMLRDWQHEQLDLTQYTGEALTEMYATAAAGIQAGEFPAKPGSCFTCTVKRHCKYSR